MACSLCPRTNRFTLLPEGPTAPGSTLLPARLFFLGEAPTRDEDRYGHAWAGRNGREFLELYLPISGIDYTTIVTATARRCSNSDYSVPTDIECASCTSQWLGPLLAQVRPVIIVAMGTPVCALFPEVGDLRLQHGIPVVSAYGSWRGIVFPTYHPNLGISAPGFMIALMDDFKRLGKLVKEVL